MIHKTFVKTKEGPVARVTFALPDSMWADEVYLVGDFNAWNRTSHPFQRGRGGHWVLTVDLELGRAYQFRYLRDGRDWMNERQADCFVPNLYGTDSFVIVTDPNFEPYCDERN